MIFAEKEKEPVLSSYMQDVLKRSRGDEKNNAHCDYTIHLKHKIKQTLIHDEDLLRTLHYEPFLGTENELNGDKYFEKCIFPYMRLPDLKSDVRNYICYEIEERHGYNTTIEFSVTFRCISHKDDVTTGWGVARMDLLSAIINRDFSWQNAFSHSFIKKSEFTLLANNEYYVRDLTYLVTIPNAEYHKVNGRNIGGYRSGLSRG